MNATAVFRVPQQERERCEEIIAAKEQAARLQASNSELRRRVDELLDEVHATMTIRAMLNTTTVHTVLA